MVMIIIIIPSLTLHTKSVNADSQCRQAREASFSPPGTVHHQAVDFLVKSLLQ